MKIEANSCMLSGLHLNNKNVVMFLISPALKNVHNYETVSTDFYYPISLGVRGHFSKGSEFASFKDQRECAVVLGHFLKGVKVELKAKFNFETLLECINDNRNDAHGTKAKWFLMQTEIWKELCATRLVFIDGALYSWICSNRTKTDNLAHKEAIEKLKSWLEYGLNKKGNGPKYIFDRISILRTLKEAVCPVFWNIHKPLLRAAIEKNQSREETMRAFNGFEDYLNLEAWMLNLAKIWAPPAHRTKNADEAIASFAQVVAKLALSQTSKLKAS